MNRATTFVRSLLVVGILVSGASRVAATPVTYSSLSLETNNDPGEVGGGPDYAADLAASTPVESQFLNALGSHGTETYDNPSYTQGYDGPFSFVPTTITATTPAQIGFQGVQPVASEGLSVSGNALLGFVGGTDNEFDLSAPVTAFGTYISQAADSGYSDDMSLVLVNTNNSFSETIPIGTLANADFDNIFYFGVTDAANPFNEVILTGVTNNPQSDGVLLDNTTVGFAPVPEPSSLALVCGSLLTGLAFFVRRASARGVRVRA